MSRPTTIQSVTVSLGGGTTVQCEIVDRAEGMVARFTVRQDGRLVGGDTRWRFFAAARVLVEELGVSPGVATVVLTHAQQIAEAAPAQRSEAD